MGLIGENGAGKSTLMKILSGVYHADKGEVTVAGKAVDYRTPREALEDGICMIYQELNLMDKLTVADNIFIGRESGKGIFRGAGRTGQGRKNCWDALDYRFP